MAQVVTRILFRSRLRKRSFKTEISRLLNWNCLVIVIDFLYPIFQIRVDVNEFTITGLSFWGVLFSPFEVISKGYDLHSLHKLERDPHLYCRCARLYPTYSQHWSYDSQHYKNHRKTICN
ncbi:hypothetical protein GJ496_001840 [Pomphorhynchus laevis]|nr:hypothetical protein GJ496_001840 [Pomphorhynchus laevis]